MAEKLEINIESNGKQNPQRPLPQQSNRKQTERLSLHSVFYIKAIARTLYRSLDEDEEDDDDDDEEEEDDECAFPLHDVTESTFP